MKGYVVIPNPGTDLVSGSCRYTHAIVASEFPFVLVSEWGDMMWAETIKPTDVTVICRAHPDVWEVVQNRLQREFRREVIDTLVEALKPFSEHGTDLANLMCHKGLTTPENCGRCKNVLAARAAIKAAKRLLP